MWLYTPEYDELLDEVCRITSVDGENPISRPVRSKVRKLFKQFVKHHPKEEFQKRDGQPFLTVNDFYWLSEEIADAVQYVFRKLHDIEFKPNPKSKADIAWEWMISPAGEIACLRMMPYEKYLKTKHWQQKRQSALAAADYKCQRCNSKERLDVHHHTYQRLGNELPEDLTVFCRDCHSKHHGKSPNEGRRP